MEEKEALEQRLCSLESSIRDMQGSLKHLTDMGVFFDQETYSHMLKTAISEVLRDEDKAGKLSEIAWLSRIAIFLLCLFFALGSLLLVWLAS
jgi:hypothetical protein